MRIRIALAALCAAATPSSAVDLAQLAPPLAIAGMVDRVCVAAYPNPAAQVPAIAGAEKWDRLGVKPNAAPGAVGWLVSLAGQPAIVDVSAQQPHQTCSVSTTAAPDLVTAYWRTRLGRAPDEALTNDRVEKRVWAWTSKGVPGTISVFTQPGQPMVRVTVASGPLPVPAKGPVR